MLIGLRGVNLAMRQHHDAFLEPTSVLETTVHICCERNGVRVPFYSSDEGVVISRRDILGRGAFDRLEKVHLKLKTRQQLCKIMLCL